jgi:hypothetical protein
MIRITPRKINFNDCNEMHEGLESFELIKIAGSEAKFILSGVTLRKIQGRRDGIGNFYYDQINRLIVGFPYKIDTKLENDLIIFEEGIDENNL